MKKIFTALLCMVAANAMANDATIKSKLQSLGASNIDVKSSPISGIKTAVTDQGVLYVTDDGKYAFQGKLYELTNNGPVDVAGKILVDKLNSYKNEMIVYPAKNEKYVVTVFMDITCHYCHILFENVKAYNEEGITLRFLAFPRAGVNTQTAKQMEAIWQAKDRMKALEDAEAGNLPKELKTPNLVKKHYELGIQFGVTGTPYMVTDKGEVIGGYVPAKELAKMLSE